jgi:hypothetical protein
MAHNGLGRCKADKGFKSVTMISVLRGTKRCDAKISCPCTDMLDLIQERVKRRKRLVLPTSLHCSKIKAYISGL